VNDQPAKSGATVQAVIAHGDEQDQGAPRGASESPAAEAASPATFAANPPSVRDRSLVLLLWYKFVRHLVGTLMTVILPWRATGQSHIPAAGGLLLVSNHLSFLDVFFLGIPLRRPLNYVARSTLFVPILAALMRSVGGFPIQREGIGAAGLKETLRRLRKGGIVTLFPEGTRSPDGRLGPLKPGIAVLVSRANVPVVPVGLAGTFEVWPRSRRLPVPHPVRIHYGAPIFPEELTGMDTAAVTALIRQRLEDCHHQAESKLRRDMSYD
jgi:1-acyl-sn-glycerol-3-phosphate acyltransferase